MIYDSDDSRLFPCRVLLPPHSSSAKVDLTDRQQRDLKFMRSIPRSRYRPNGVVCVRTAGRRCLRSEGATLSTILVAVYRVGRLHLRFVVNERPRR